MPSSRGDSFTLLKTGSHLRELVRGSSSDLGYPESSKLLLELLQLRPKLALALLAQLMRLELGCKNRAQFFSRLACILAC